MLGAAQSGLNAVGFLLEAGRSDLPEAVRERGRIHILDTAAVGVGGARTDLARIARGFAAAQFGAGVGPGAHLWGDGRVVSAAGAAFANAAAIDALDGHDGHSLTKGHVSCGLLPALLAAAEQERMEDDLEARLDDFIIATEIGIRAGVALHRTASDYHTSGAWVAIAAAGAAARILGLGAETAAHALGAAEYYGPRSPMMRCIAHPTMLKDGSAFGALAGVSAAYLALSGFTGAPAELTEHSQTTDLWSDLGARWRIEEQYLKPYPVCRWAHPAIDAALAIRTETPVDPAAIQSIDVRTFAAAAALDQRAPKNTEQAQYALPWPVAAVFARGRVGAETVAAETLEDPLIAALAAKVRLHEDASMTAAFPAERRSRVQVTLADGAVLDSGDVFGFGDPERPLAGAAFDAKLDDVAGADKAAALRKAVASGSGRALLDALGAL